QLRDDLEALGGTRSRRGGGGEEWGTANGRAASQIPLEEVGRAGARPTELGAQILGDLHPLPHIVELLTKAIIDEPPALTREGGMFRDGYFAGLDELRNAAREGKDWIAQLQQ